VIIRWGNESLVTVVDDLGWAKSGQSFEGCESAIAPKLAPVLYFCKDWNIRSASDIVSLILHNHAHPVSCAPSTSQVAIPSNSGSDANMGMFVFVLLLG